MRPERSRLGWLLLLAVVPPVLEAAVLVVIGFRAAEGLAPQATAVWPYDAYHDLRWLLVYHRSVVGFVVALLVVVALRALLSAGLIVLAWPAGTDRPGYWRLAARNAGVAVLAMVVISPWAALSVAASVVPLSWFLLASVLPLTLLAPFLLRAGVTAGWWRGLPSIELVGWSLLNFALLTVAGGVVWSTPDWWTVLVSAVAGAANGLLWARTVRAVVRPSRIRWARLPMAPVVSLLSLLLPLGVLFTLRAVQPDPTERWTPPLVSRPLPASVGHVVIGLAGHNSSYDGSPGTDPRLERYSYRGLDAVGRPLAYRPEATHQSLEVSAALLAAQVDAAHRRTGLPVALIGESEGALVARTFLERWPRGPVDTLIMSSPLVQAGRAYFPPPEAGEGWGIVAGWQIRLLFAVGDLAADTDSTPDDPFIRSILDAAPLYRNRLMCPVAGVRVIAFVPTTTAIEAPPGEYARIPVFQLPAFHGGLLGRPLVQDRLVDFLAELPVELPRRREYPFLQRLAAAWQAPPLAVSVNPVWAGAGQPDPSFTGLVCQPAQPGRQRGS